MQPLLKLVPRMGVSCLCRPLSPNEWPSRHAASRQPKGGRMLANCVIHGTCIRTRLSRMRSLEVSLVIFGEQRFSTHRVFQPRVTVDAFGGSHVSVVALIYSRAGRLAGDVPVGRGTLVRICAGHNDDLRRPAQSIITGQNDEVSAIRSAVGGGAPTQACSASNPQAKFSMMLVSPCIKGEEPLGWLATRIASQERESLQ
jgi:hypothetical protein